MIITDFDREVYKVMEKRNISDNDIKDKERYRSIMMSFVVFSFNKLVEKEIKKIDRFKNYSDEYLPYFSISNKDRDNRWYVIIPNKRDKDYDRLYDYEIMSILEKFDREGYIKLINKEPIRSVYSKKLGKKIIRQSYRRCFIEILPKAQSIMLNYVKLIKR